MNLGGVKCSKEVIMIKNNFYHIYRLSHIYIYKYIYHIYTYKVHISFIYTYKFISWHNYYILKHGIKSQEKEIRAQPEGQKSNTVSY